MASIPPDEMLVQFVQARPQVIALCNDRVFHLEVYQEQDDSLAQYPCIVYQQTDDVPDREISGNNGYFTTVYSIYVIAKNSSDLVALRNDIYWLGSEDFNTSIFQDTSGDYDMFEGIDVDSSSEDDEFAIEQQERGLKISTVIVSFANSRCGDPS